MDTVLLNTIPGISLWNMANKQLKQEKEKEKEKFSDASDTTIVVISNLISLALGVGAAYLSWQCNTAADVPTAQKVLFAFFAFLFGFLYLILYAIFLSGRCGSK
jgi:hypothetical protein